MEEEALPQERYMISEERMGRAEMEERLSRPEMEERMVRPEMEEKLRVPVSLEKPIVNQEIIDTDQKWKKNKEIIDSKSKNEMKKRQS